MRRPIACITRVVACASAILALVGQPATADPGGPPMTVTLTLNGATVDDSRQTGNWDKALTQAEKDAIGAKLLSCWAIPASSLGSMDGQYAELLVRVNREGVQDTPPLVTEGASKKDEIGTQFRQAALRSWSKCQPLKGPDNKYYRWRNILIRFDPLGKKPTPSPQASQATAAPVAPSSVYVQSPTWQNVTEKVTGELNDRLTACWNQKDETGAVMKLPQVVIEFSLGRDGNVTREPVVLEIKDAKSPLAQSAVKRAKAAIYRCAPYTYLPKKAYEHWRTITVQF